MKKIHKVKGYRNMLGLTQSEMGEIIGCSEQSYNNKERGRTAFSDEEKMKFKQVLLPLFPSITVDEIFFG